MSRVDTSLDALQDIRRIMNSSTRFLTLSGWSGIFAGTISLVAAFIAMNWLDGWVLKGDDVPQGFPSIRYDFRLLERLVLLALLTFILALGAAFLFTWKKANREKKKLWDPAAQKMVFSLFLPVFAGGVFVTGLLYNGAWQMIVPASLVFYGLGLVSASRFTFTDVKYMGIANIILGAVSMFYPGYGLYFWALGFGIFHIIYGVMMFKKGE
ncbi:MAG: hypothetical protein ACXWV5_07465 [Flavitalea sp.]